MASSSTNLSLPSSSSTHRWTNDVFLCFRGKDTRHSFTAHLSEALSREGIKTFKDNKLMRGEKISLGLRQAIEESRFSIIIFSKRYASSTWCLEELTKILECVQQRGHTTLPVFYNVDPSHVRKQKGSFAEALARHEQVYGKKRKIVVKWRKSLTKAGRISGWDSRNRNEAKLIKKIVAWILKEKECNAASSSNMDNVSSSSNMDAPVGNAKESPSSNLGSGGKNFGNMSGGICITMGPNHGTMQIGKESKRDAASSGNMDDPSSRNMDDPSSRNMDDPSSRNMDDPSSRNMDA